MVSALPVHQADVVCQGVPLAGTKPSAAAMALVTPAVLATTVTVGVAWAADRAPSRLAVIRVWDRRDIVDNLTLWQLGSRY